MAHRASNHILVRILGNMADIPPGQRPFHTFATCGYGATALVQGVYALLLARQGMLPLAAVCGLLALSMAAAIGINLKGWMKAALASAYVSIMLLAPAAAYLSGNTGFHHHLIPLIVLTVLFPSRRKISRIGLALLASAEYVALSGYGPSAEPAVLTYLQTAALLRVANLYISLFVLSFAAVYYGFAMERASEKHERDQRQTQDLLHNVLPEDIANRLGMEPGGLTDAYENATILFSDVVEFTSISKTMPPGDVVGFLDRMFSCFDDLAEKHGLEKIKTIGDAYMCAAGIPHRRNDHAEIAARMALDMMEAFSRLAAAMDRPMQLRIGINSGAVVAGVIGKKKYSYDLWGDSVNAASRMASHGVPGEIQVTESTGRLVRDKFVLEQRGRVKVKGMGVMTTFLLKGPRPR